MWRVVSDYGGAGGGWMLASSFASTSAFEVVSDFSRTNPMDGAVTLAECPQANTESGRLSPEGVIYDDTCMTTASGNKQKKEKNDSM